MEGIDVRDVSYAYPNGTVALKRMSMRIQGGESIALLGPNGAGKTTIIKLLNGLLKPTSGSVTVDDLNTKDVPVSRLARKVGIVFQNAEKQFFAETVHEELAFGPRNMGFGQDQIEAMVLRVARTFGIEQYLERSPFSLSGGEKKRLSIASVLVWDPAYVVIDEPTVGLDFRYRRLLVDITERTVAVGKTVLVVTHDVDFALLTSKRAVVVCDGTVLNDGPLLDVLMDEKLISGASLVPTFTLKAVKLLREKGIEPTRATELVDLLNWGPKAT